MSDSETSGQPISGGVDYPVTFSYQDRKMLADLWEKAFRPKVSAARKRKKINDDVHVNEVKSESKI